MDRGAIVSAFRWLSRGDWTAASLTGLVVDGASLQLTPSPGSAARRGVAVILAGIPDAAQVDATSADRWRRVGVRLAAPLPAAAWVRVWTRVAPVAPIPAPPGVSTSDLADDSSLATPALVWRAAAVDALDVRVLCLEPGPLWVAIELGGRGAATARVADVLVETGDDGPVADLPVAYRVGAGDAVDEGNGILGRFLGLLDAERRRTSSVLDELPTLLTAHGAPDRDDAPWLARLARWIAVDDEQLPADTAGRRDVILHAPERHARRGTRDGLIDEVSRRTGIDRARIEVSEPLLDAEIWRLTTTSDPTVAETSALGVTTGLLSADPGPPALDTTAYLDASQLIGDEAGLPVHAAVAHRICVHVLDGTAAQVRVVDAVVQHERPAHVLARTCAVTRTTGLPTIVGVDALPDPGPPGLADDTVHSPRIDGPGQRIGAARLPAVAPTNSGTSSLAQEGEAP